MRLVRAGAGVAGLEFVHIDVDDGRPPFGGQLKAGLSSRQKGYLAMPRK
jgi:hypothetical protein